MTQTLRFTVAVALAVAMIVVPALASDKPSQTSGTFSGAKVNGGTVTYSKANGHSVLTLSEDFVVPDTPAPHWQVVDSKGNIYLLNRLVIKDDHYNQTITLPSYIKDVARVQIWCAWAEALLGETSFPQPVK